MMKAVPKISCSFGNPEQKWGAGQALPAFSLWIGWPGFTGR